MSPGRRWRDRPRFDTRAVHGGNASPLEACSGSPLSLPIVQSSTYSFDSPEEMVEVLSGARAGYIYSRYDNPTIHAVEEKLAALEGGDRALLFSSGLAAIHAALWSRSRDGGRLIAGRDLYGGTISLMEQLLPRLGIAISRIDLADPAAVEREIRGGACAIFLETPTNPLLRIVDGPGVARVARDAGIPVIVDNTFATPVLQNPLEWGAELVLHSATKYLGGHSDLTLGVAVGSDATIARLEHVRRTLGGSADPFAGWLLNRGLATLPIRVRRQSETAARLAAMLESEPTVSKVHYPGLASHPGHAIARRQMNGFGGMLSFELRGGLDAAMEFLRGLCCVRIATSLGGVESVASHPVTSSHRMVDPESRKAAGITDGLIRLSAGLEDPEDLIDDLRSALRRTQPASK